jgi:hypothetical protein
MAEIYKIEDDIYHKIYIGQTSQVCQRRPKYNSSCGYVWRYIYDEEINRPVPSEVAELATLLSD